MADIVHLGPGNACISQQWGVHTCRMIMAGGFTKFNTSAERQHLASQESLGSQQLSIPS